MAPRRILLCPGSAFGGGNPQKPVLPAATLQLSPEQQRTWNNRAFDAIRDGSLERLMQCIMEGADPNAQNNYGESLLWKACYEGAEKCRGIIKYLANLPSVDLNKRSFEGHTPSNAADVEGFAILQDAANSRSIELDWLGKGMRP
ncbi:MAG: hypothetical protein ACP5NX_00785 [Candidatus Bilamarchaeaceae archaeon]